MSTETNIEKKTVWTCGGREFDTLEEAEAYDLVDWIDDECPVLMATKSEAEIVEFGEAILKYADKINGILEARELRSCPDEVQ